MLRFNRVIKSDTAAYSSLTLNLEQRVKSRQRVTLDNGREAGLFLPRGSVLQQGDRLQAESGEIIEIRAARERVSTVYINDPVLMARACYHLGNRHVPLQISSGFVRYQHDHVLDDMLRRMGLHINLEQAPFEPEAGAYGGHQQTHGHQHAHGHHH